MSDAFVKAELTAACSNLGCSDGVKYHKEPHCLEALKDLIRYLRRDDETFTIRRELGDMKVIQTDLIPLMVEYASNKELFEVNLRLLVNLTNPTILLFKEEMPAERVTRNYYLQLVGQLQSCKEHLASDKFWTVLTDKLTGLLKLDWESRLEDDRLVIERILILIRNILHIPADPEAEKRTDDDASIHDQVLWSMHLSGTDNLLLYLASSDSEQNFCMHVLEIVSLMLREQEPQQLGTAAVQRTLSEKQEDEQALLKMRNKELTEKKEKMHKLLSTRHSRFGGTFVVKDLKSISDKDLITHKPIAGASSLDFDKDKKPSRKPSNRLPADESQLTRRSTLSIRLFLKEFSLELLTGAYNRLMFIVKDNLVRARTQEHDETYYLWAMKFFMEFNRHCKFRVEVVSETMSVQVFHYIQTQLETYVDMIKVDKTKMKLWCRRMHLALKAYQELLMTLTAMVQCKEQSVRESAKVIQGNVFYVLEYRELCLHLLQTFDPVKHSKSYLKDLVETTHIFLKLLESFAKSSRHLVVQKKTVARRKKKPKKTGPGEPSRTVDVSWDEISSDISNILHGLDDTQLPNDVIPFDSASSVPIDEQKVDAIRRIQRLMKGNKLAETVSLLRASRLVWPENDVFGAANAGPDEEFLTLRDAFFADLPPGPLPDPNPATDAGHVSPEDDAEAEFEDEEVEEEEMASVRVAEQELHFEEFVMRFAHHRVLQAHAFLLQHFATNSTFTNHCIVKMLHRMAWDCKMPAMLFQASIFRTFQKILRDKSCATDASMKELAKFACFVVRKFTEVASKNPKVYMELLFWKTARDAAEIEEGYGTYKEKSKSLKSVWTEEEEFQLEHLYGEFMAKNDSGGDAAEFITENLIGQTKSKRLVIKKMKALGLQTGKSKASKFSRPPPEWAEEETHQLQQLVQQHLSSMDPLSRIVEGLSVQRPKNRVREKILQLGIVADPKLLRKKRSQKGRRRNSSSSSSSSDEDKTNEKSHMRSKLAAQDESSDDDAFDRLLAAHRQPRAAPRPGNHGEDLSLPPLESEVFSPRKLQTLVEAEISKGHREALEWVAGLLEEEAGDRHIMSGSAEAIPVVPLTDTALSAMDAPGFCQILPSLGLLPPADVQEQFWRIGAHLASAALLSRAEFLKRALRGETNVTEEVKDGGSALVSSGKRRFVLLDEDLSDTPNEQEKSKLNVGDESLSGALMSKSATPLVAKLDENESDSDVEIKPKRPRMQIDSDSD